MAFAYPAHTLLLFAPCARFSWSVVRLTFLLMLPLLTAATIPLWLRIAGIELSRTRTLLVLILTLASWPVLSGIHQIQPTLMVAFLAAAGCYLVQRGKCASAGVVFALATIKPQLVGPLIAWLVLWTLLRRQWTFLISFSATVATLLVLATRMVPGWLTNWRAAMADYAQYRHLQPELAFLFGRWPALVFGFVLACSALMGMWRSRQCPPDSREFGSICALALALTVCLLPTELAMSYNYVLLLPAFLILFFCAPQSSFAPAIRRFACAQLVLDFVAVLVAVVGETFTKPSNSWDSLPFMDFLLPTLTTVFLIVEALQRPALLDETGPAATLDLAGQSAG